MVGTPQRKTQRKIKKSEKTKELKNIVYLLIQLTKYSSRSYQFSSVQFASPLM